MGSKMSSSILSKVLEQKDPAESLTSAITRYVEKNSDKKESDVVMKNNRSFINKKAVRNYVNEHGLECSKTLINALEGLVKNKIDVGVQETARLSKKIVLGDFILRGKEVCYVCYFGVGAVGEIGGDATQIGGL